MSEQERLAIEAACSRLAFAFCQYSDADRCDLYEALFTEEARFKRPDGELVSARNIAAALAKRPSGAAVRHLCANPIVEVIDADRACGSGNLMVVRHDRQSGITQPPVYGDYVDEYVRGPGGWQIASREVSFSFRPEALG